MKPAFWIVLLLALVPAAPADQSADVINLSGRLAGSEAKDRVTKQSHRAHTVRFFAGRTYTIDLKSKAFDAYLRLEGPDGRELARDDDSGSQLNARIVLRVTKSGMYRVVVTTFGQSKGGAYVLTVRPSARSAVSPEAR